MFLEVVIAIGIGCALPMTYLTVCKRKIRKELRRKRGDPVSITWAPPWLETESEERHETRFEVRYKDSSGESHMAICTTRPFSGVYWKENP
ncbi:MAG TPA: hypothetical protein VN445_09155 [Rectinemataceae bacterium]|nr:hypothetical protein [Rectinemataceae bacterium]